MPTRDQVSAEDKAKYGGKDQDSTWAYIEYSDANEKTSHPQASRERRTAALDAGYRLSQGRRDQQGPRERRKLVVFSEAGAEATTRRARYQGSAPGIGRKGPAPRPLRQLYGHGVRLFSRRVVVDGVDHDIRNLLADPILGPMLRDGRAVRSVSASYG